MKYIHFTPTLCMPLPLLEITHLARLHPDGSGHLLHPADVSIFAGDRIVISGRAGSGKSLLLRAIARLDNVQLQRMMFLQKAVDERDLPRYRSRVQLVHQHVELIDGSVEDNIRLPLRFSQHKHRSFDSNNLHRALDFFQQPKDFFQRHSSDLSGGERQIVNLLRSLSLSPQLLLLDEPSAALDHASAQLLESYVQQWLAESPNERAYVWVSHSREQMQRVGHQHWHMVSGKLHSQAPTTVTDETEQNTYTTQQIGADS